MAFGGNNRNTRNNRSCTGTTENMMYPFGQCCRGGTFWNGSTDVQCSSLWCPLCEGQDECHITDNCGGPGPGSYCAKNPSDPKCSMGEWGYKGEAPVRQRGGRIKRQVRRNVEECWCEIFPSYCPPDDHGGGNWEMPGWCETTYNNAADCEQTCQRLSQITCDQCGSLSLGGMCAGFSWFGKKACSQNHQPMEQTNAVCDFQTTGWNQYGPVAGGGVGEPTMYQLEMYCCYYNCFSFGALGQQWCLDYYLGELGGNCDLFGY